MSENKFTPGPWDIRTLENFGFNIVHYVDGDKFNIARVAKVSVEANARLIAEAPNLLKALQNFVEPYNGFSDEELARRVDIATYRRIIEAQDAIRKATGEA